MNRAEFVEICSIEDLQSALAESGEDPVVLFKHSVTCPISRDVLELVSAIPATVYMVVVQRARSVSDEIEEITGIRHESPQAIVVLDGSPVYSASHYDVSPERIVAAIRGS